VPFLWNDVISFRHKITDGPKQEHREKGWKATLFWTEIAPGGKRRPKVAPASQPGAGGSDPAWDGKMAPTVRKKVAPKAQRGGSNVVGKLPIKRVGHPFHLEFGLKWLFGLGLRD
jgi:hypothetical protein